MPTSLWVYAIDRSLEYLIYGSRISGWRGAEASAGAEVKLADSWGDTVWGCMAHAEEALLNARGAFLASEDGLGLGPFLRARQAQPEHTTGS